MHNVNNMKKFLLNVANVNKMNVHQIHASKVMGVSNAIYKTNVVFNNMKYREFHVVIRQILWENNVFVVEGM